MLAQYAVQIYRAQSELNKEWKPFTKKLRLACKEKMAVPTTCDGMSCEDCAARGYKDDLFCPLFEDVPTSEELTEEEIDKQKQVCNAIAGSGSVTGIRRSIKQLRAWYQAEQPAFAFVADLESVCNPPTPAPTPAPTKKPTAFPTSEDEE